MNMDSTVKTKTLRELFTHPMFPEWVEQMRGLPEHDLPGYEDYLYGGERPNPMQGGYGIFPESPDHFHRLSVKGYDLEGRMVVIVRDVLGTVTIDPDRHFVALRAADVKILFDLAVKRVGARRGDYVRGCEMQYLFWEGGFGRFLLSV